jgi:hypothetical protein
VATCISIFHVHASLNILLPPPMHLQEKNRLLADLKRLKDHYAKYEPTILELKRKYEGALRDKMLLSLERDRSRDKVGAGCGAGGAGGDAGIDACTKWLSLARCRGQGGCS